MPRKVYRGGESRGHPQAVPVDDVTLEQGLRMTAGLAIFTARVLAWDCRRAKWQGVLHQ
jgi:hypothetical protein